MVSFNTASPLRYPTPPVRLPQPKNGSNVTLVTNHAICGSRINIAAEQDRTINPLRGRLYVLVHQVPQRISLSFRPCCNYGSVIVRTAHSPIAKLRPLVQVAASATGGAPITPHTSLILAAERQSRELTAQIKLVQTCRKTSARCKTSKTPATAARGFILKERETGDCGRAQRPSPTKKPLSDGGSKFSLRLGHAAGLTPHRGVIQHRVAASLPRPTMCHRRCSEKLMDFALYGSNPPIDSTGCTAMAR